MGDNQQKTYEEKKRRFSGTTVGGLSEDTISNGDCFLGFIWKNQIIFVHSQGLFSLLHQFNGRQLWTMPFRAREKIATYFSGIKIINLTWTKERRP